MREQALKAIEGVGDSDLGEWEERGEGAYHVRRRQHGQKEARPGQREDAEADALEHRFRASHWDVCQKGSMRFTVAGCGKLRR